MSNRSDSDDTAGGRQYVGRFTDAPIGAVREPVGVRWLFMLVTFMRLAAAFWMLKGLLHWAYIVGLGEPGFGDLRLSRQGLFMALAVFELVAAVGLWLAASWGVVVWVGVLILEGGTPFWFADMPFSLTDTALSVAAIVLYLGFALQARREQAAAYH
jgi:hypothetical protein